MRKTTFVLAISIVMIFLMVNVGLAADKIVLDFPSWQATEPGFSDWWNALIDEFESEHTNVDINFYKIPFKDYIDTLRTKFGAGNPPDIVHMPSKDALGFIELGWLQSLNSRMEGTDILENWTPLQENLEQNGNQYGVLLLGYGNSLYYNEKMFKNAGINIPKTLDEFYQAAQKLTIDKNNDGNIDQFGFGMTTTTNPAVYTNSMMFVIGYDGVFSKEGKLTVHDPGVVKALNLIDKLAKNDLMPMGITASQMRSYFFEGKIAMIFDGPWLLSAINDLDSEIAKNLKVTIPPTNSGHIAGGISNSIHLPQGISNEKADLVWEFIYKLTRKEWQRKYIEYTSSPAPRSGTIDEEILNNIPEMEIFAECAKIAKSPLPSGYETQYTIFQKNVTDSIMKVITSNATIDSVLDELEEKLYRDLE